MGAEIVVNGFHDNARSWRSNDHNVRESLSRRREVNCACNHSSMYRGTLLSSGGFEIEGEMIGCLKSRTGGRMIDIIVCSIA